jgi:2-oxoglutarate/2-oxoacid ferredoxin oxidoreductase subunit alpha
MQTPVQIRESVVIRFAGDSGDGMQLTGTQFTNTSALLGNDLATFPDFPAEIRAPAGTRAGVSGFQLHFSSDDIYTPGDSPGVLVAMNPAALIKNISDLARGGICIVNTDKFGERDLAKADLETNPLEDGTLDGFRTIPVKLSTLVKLAVKPHGLNAKESDRCKNFFALGLTYWMFNRPMETTQGWIKGKFKGKFMEANLAALQAGYNYAITAEIHHETYDVKPAKLAPGLYRNITGSEAVGLGFVTAGMKADLPVFLGSYPITPASDMLHVLSKYKHVGVSTFQAEDEIAAVCSAIGAAYGGSLALTTTSGPGLALKGEAIGLAMMVELPLVIVDAQRGGPSTGLPTKTEQSDLLFAMYGRNGESPMPIIAAATPSDCFDATVEACRISLEHMVPVLLLTDGYMANGAEPWLIPDADSIPEIKHRLNTEHNNPDGDYLPYKRDPETLARSWAVPGTPGLEHRVGGLEKQDETGHVSYDPDNHQLMTNIRQAKVDRIANHIPELTAFGADSGTLVLGWGSTYGAIRQAVVSAQARGIDVAHAHLRHMNPFPRNLGDMLDRYDTVIIPEMNMGQLNKLIRARYLLDVVSLPKVTGQPFKVQEILAAIDANQ